MYDLVKSMRSNEKGGKHFENFLNQLHALHVESEEAYPRRNQVMRLERSAEAELLQADVREHIKTFVDYLSLVAHCMYCHCV